MNMKHHSLSSCYFFFLSDLQLHHIVRLSLLRQQLENFKMKRQKKKKSIQFILDPDFLWNSLIKVRKMEVFACANWAKDRPRALFTKFFFQTQIGKKNWDFYFELRITKAPPPFLTNGQEITQNGAALKLRAQKDTVINRE